MNTADELLALVARATAADHVDPLNETGLRAVRERRTIPEGSAGDTIELTRVRGDVVAFAVLDEDAAQLVVDPEHRRRGHGRELARRILQQHPGLQFWSFGGLAPAAGLARDLGLTAVRELLIMERDLAGRPEVPVPDDLTIRPYALSDREDLLRINAAAFAHHPEQGRMDAADLAARMAEDWFDPAGLLMAERDGRVVGFHWTKQHSTSLGEVYVIGVDPTAHGGGIGKALLAAGLDHLAAHGMQRVILWVEGSEEGPVALYQKTGFTVTHRDIRYGHVEETPR